MRARSLTLVSLFVSFAACSNAADPVAPDGQIVAPHDAAGSQLDAGATDARPAVDGAQLQVLAINEVAAGETPDWFEVVNLSPLTLTLSDFVYCDVADDFVKAKPFAAITLAPGAYYAQAVDDASSGFKLAGDEELHVYFAADHAVVDAVDWASGDSPAGGSFARSPDRTGAFATTTTPTKGVANP